MTTPANPLPGAAIEAAERALTAQPGAMVLSHDAMVAMLEAAAPHLAAAERQRLLSPSPGAGSCCDLHGRHCEPGELCCERCTEADHPGHAQLSPCSAPILSPGTLDEARRIAVAVAAEREAAEARHMEYLSKLTREYDANLRASVAAAAHEALCWEQPADGRLIACDRMKDHKGGHSWEAAGAVAAERERCAQLADKVGAVIEGNCQKHEDCHCKDRLFADLLRQGGGT